MLISVWIVWSSATRSRPIVISVVGIFIVGIFTVVWVVSLPLSEICRVSPLSAVAIGMMRVVQWVLCCASM